MKVLFTVRPPVGGRDCGDGDIGSPFIWPPDGMARCVQFGQTHFWRYVISSVVNLMEEKYCILTCMEWLLTGFRLVIGFSELFNVQFVTTLYNPLSHTDYCSQFVTVSTSRCFVAASNGGRSPSSGCPNCPRLQLPASHSNSSQQQSPSGYLINQLIHSTDWLTPQ
jgi:hypothetical protein